jgi:hypothetical protein
MGAQSVSTHWGYHCEKCDEDSPHWFNHGESILREFAQHWPILKPVYELAQNGAGWLELRVLGAYDEPGPLDFL